METVKEQKQEKPTTVKSFDGKQDINIKNWKQSPYYPIRLLGKMDDSGQTYIEGACHSLPASLSLKGDGTLQFPISVDFQLTKEIHNGLVDTFAERAKNFEYKGKRLILFQQEFFVGAIRAFDLMTGSENSCITPSIYFSLIRGELIKKIA